MFGNRMARVLQHYQSQGELVGWHNNKSIENVLQKTSNRVFVYISETTGGFQTQLYLRGYSNMSACQLELRSPDKSRENFDKLIQVSELWLTKYNSGNLELIHQDNYSILNPNGAWGLNRDSKLYYLEQQSHY